MNWVLTAAATESTPAVSGMGVIDLVVVVVSLVLVIALGIFCARGPKDTANYLLGSRSMPWWAIGISYMMSILSTLSIVSIPGEAYNNGVTLALGQMLFPVFVLITFFVFIRFYFTSFIFTPFQYLENRFDRRARTVAAAVFWMTRLVYIALVLYSAATVCEGAMGWPVWLTIIAVGMVGITYTVLGGFKAVVFTDVFQFVVLAGGLVVTLIVAMRAVPDGFAGVWAFAQENGRGFAVSAEEDDFYSLSPFVRITIWTVFLGPLVASMFGNSSDQISIQRLLGTKGYGEAKKSMFVFIILFIPTMSVLWLVGLAMFSYYGHQPEGVQPEKGDLALFQFIGTQLPTPIPGIIMAGLLAAILSTLDSATNSLATVATKDFYKPLFRKDATEEQQVDFSKRFSIFIGVFAIAGAILLSIVSGRLEESIMEASKVWMAFAGVLPPAFLLGMTSRRLGGRGVFTAMLAGWGATIVVMGWYVYTRMNPEGPQLSFLVTAIPPLVVTLVVGFALAWMTPKQPTEKLDDLTLFTLRKKAPADQPEGSV